MDESNTRRGKPCWYKKVGLIGINDAVLLESKTYRLLSMYNTNDHQNFRDIQQLFLDIAETTKYGQALDMTTEHENQSLCFTENYTMERYESIVTFKTAFYTVYLPIGLALMLTKKLNNIDQEQLDLLMDICKKLGWLFQVQDDFLDVYGDVSITGKIGTDIQDKKCSWLVCRALQLATPEHKQTLKEHYGKPEEEPISKVKTVFNDLNILKEYQELEQKESDILIERLNE